MTDEFDEAAKKLSDSERRAALESFVETAGEPAAGIARQLLGSEEKPLTKKQQNVFEKYIGSSLVEKCAIPGCSGFSVAGQAYCATCEVEYGGK